MKNFIQPGKVLTAIAGVGGVRSGTIQVIGKIVGIAATAAAVGEEYELALGECYEVPKAAGAAWAMGDELFYDATAKVVTKTGTNNTKIGVAAQAARSADAIGVARFNDSF